MPKPWSGALEIGLEGFTWEDGYTGTHYKYVIHLFHKYLLSSCASHWASAWHNYILPSTCLEVFAKDLGRSWGLKMSRVLSEKPQPINPSQRRFSGPDQAILPTDAPRVIWCHWFLLEISFTSTFSVSQSLCLNTSCLSLICRAFPAFIPFTHEENSLNQPV